LDLVLFLKGQNGNEIEGKKATALLRQAEMASYVCKKSLRDVPKKVIENPYKVGWYMMIPELSEKVIIEAKSLQGVTRLRLL